MVEYNDEKWLTVKEVTDKLNTSHTSVYRKIKEKNWRVIKTDGKYHINENDIDKNRVKIII